METATVSAPAGENGGGPPPPTVPSVTTFPPDKLGREFDATKFRTDEGGQPRLDSLGRFIPLKGGRNRADGTSAQPRNGQTLPEPPKANFEDLDKIASEGGGSPSAAGGGSSPVDEYTTAAVASVSMLSTAAILVMGAQVKPSADQMTAMVQAYADCYRAYGYKPTTPPWLGPVVATGAWIGPHLRSQEAQTNLQKAKAKVIGFLGWFRGRRDARAAARVSTEVEQRAN